MASGKSFLHPHSSVPFQQEDMSITNDKDCFPFLSLLVLKKNLLLNGLIQWATNRKRFGFMHSLFWLLYQTQNAGGVAFLKSSGFLNFPVKVIFSLWFTWGVTPVKNHHLFFAPHTARRWLFCTRSQSCWKKHFYIASSYMTMVQLLTWPKFIIYKTILSCFKEKVMQVDKIIMLLLPLCHVESWNTTGVVILLQG